MNGAEVGTARLASPGVVHVAIDEPTIDASIGQAVRQIAAGIAGEPYAIVADLRRIGFVGRDARAWAASSSELEPAAIAVVVSSPSLQAIARGYAKVRRQRTKFDIFLDVDEAMGWAASVLDGGSTA